MPGSSADLLTCSFAVALLVACAVVSVATAPRVAAGEEQVVLPDGTPFPFWDDHTDYRKTYHVACQDQRASDASPGTQEQPFKTIGRAAEVLQPGEKVVVHAGLYRECVSPKRGGNGPDSMIAYQAADGEKVLVTGAIEWKPRCQPSSGWGQPAGAKNIWMADLPAEAFVGYNPFLARNIHEEFVIYRHLDDVPKYMLRRGMIFVDGQPLRQVSRFADLAKQAGAFWAEEPGLRVHFRLPGDADPGKAAFEVTAKEQVFAPQERGLGYIRVSGFSFERAADGVPVPQRAMVSTNRGHHWIIEKNHIRWANACGMDVGSQDWKAAQPQQFGRHVIRGNHVSDCGVCGIAGCLWVDQTLVEDNVVERVGGLDIERMWEVAGLKFHVAKSVLIRRNTFRDLHRASGIWLDYLNENCRVTGNVFYGISTCAGALYLEVSHKPNSLDHNCFWDIRPSGEKPGGPKDGAALCADSCDNTIVAHNFFVNVRSLAVSVNNLQKDRVVDGRKGECRGNVVLNNVFVGCPRRIYLGRNDTNVCDGNLFDAGNKEGLFDVQDPAPNPKPRLDAWQKTFGQDNACPYLSSASRRPRRAPARS
ncbi:MAG: right-handed parallel beta-helix repeat-containing protein [Planctomycetota bacterium]|nr:right-handed parallel beta-helix repeat-containing protein [Planctomycetota bacterium]